MTRPTLELRVTRAPDRAMGPSPDGRAELVVTWDERSFTLASDLSLGSVFLDYGGTPGDDSVSAELRLSDNDHCVVHVEHLRLEGYDYERITRMAFVIARDGSWERDDAVTKEGELVSRAALGAHAT